MSHNWSEDGGELINFIDGEICSGKFSDELSSSAGGAVPYSNSNVLVRCLELEVFSVDLGIGEGAQSSQCERNLDANPYLRMVFIPMSISVGSLSSTMNDLFNSEDDVFE